MKRRANLRGHSLLLLAIAMGAAACRLLVGDDDHHLRDDADGSDGEGGALEASSDAPFDSSKGDGASVDGADSGADALVPSPYIVKVLASGRLHPNGILFLKAGLSSQLYYLYWIEETVGDGGQIMRVADRAAPGTPDVVTAGTNLRALRFDGSGVVFTEDSRPVSHLGRVQALPPFAASTYDDDSAGRSFGALGTNSPYTFAYTEALDDDNTGWHVRRSAMDAAAGPTCFAYSAASATSFTALLSDGALLFVADDATGSILRTQGGCDETPDVMATNQHVVAFTSDTAHIYWATADGHVRSMFKSNPGSTVTTYNILLTKPGALTVRNGVIYVTDEGAGMVYAITPDPATVVVASAQGGPRAITSGVTDGGIVLYWSNETSGEIVRAQLPDGGIP